MSVETDPVPPVPEHTPPLKEDEHNPQIGKYFNHVWTRWFVSLREKINVLNSSLVTLGEVTGTGILVKNGAAWVLRTLTGTDDRVTVTDGDGASGNPTVDVVTADLVAGTNVTFTGSGVDRIIDNGSGDLTISASGGGGGTTRNGGILTTADPINPDSTNARIFRDIVNSALWTASSDGCLIADPIVSGEGCVSLNGTNFVTSNVIVPALLDFTLEVLFDVTALGDYCPLGHRSTGANGWAIVFTPTGVMNFRAFIGSYSDTKLTSAAGSIVAGNRMYIRIDRKGTALRALFGLGIGSATTVIATAVVTASNTLASTGNLTLGQASSTGEQRLVGRVKQARVSAMFLPDTGVVPDVPWTSY